MSAPPAPLDDGTGGPTWVLRVAAPFDALAPHVGQMLAAGLRGAAEAGGRTELYFPARVELPDVDGAWERLAPRDWHARWRAGLAPVRAGRWTVTPTWLATGSDDELVIDPGQAFGTGHHETTVRCLEALDELDIAGRRLLDVGTGTGLLAIAAARGGATVVAVDTDPVAVAAARANADANGTDLTVLHGSVDAAPNPPYDAVIANLDTSTVVALASALAHVTTSFGDLVVSGVGNERVAEAASALERVGLTARVDRGREWALLRCQWPEDRRSHDTSPADHRIPSRS